MVSKVASSEIENRVILFMRPQAQAFLAARMETRPIAAGEVLYEAGAPFTHAIFPHVGVISLMSRMSGGRSVEKASIGREGFVGFPVIMGGKNAVSRTIVQVGGHASWLSIADLDEAMGRFECIRKIMLSYAQSLIVQVMHSVACNSLHSADQRVARWLLHAHDRVSDDNFHITQEAISAALGLRRATVSEVCSDLSRDDIIQYSRGSLMIVDRARLEHRTCECYGYVHAASFLTRTGADTLF